MDGVPPASGSPTDLGALLAAGSNTIKRRSLVFLVSDFFSAPGWERHLGRLNRRHELVALRLWDPRETELPDAGMLVVEDAETGEQLAVDTGLPEFRRRFAEGVAEREAALTEVFTRAGAETYSVSTEEDLVQALVRIATMRKRRRRAARPQG
jgi:uncharacterized protein (DUF58 family)